MTVGVVVPTLDPDSEMFAQCREAIIATAPKAFLHVGHDIDRDGFAVTCNRAAAEASSDVLVFLNDDTIPHPGWLEALTEPLSRAGIVGANLRYPDGSAQHTGVLLRRDGDLLVAENRRVESKSGPVPAVTAACLAITAENFEMLGRFDEAFVSGYEDVDLCLQARAQGLEVWYAADAVVTHLESRSPGRFDHAADNITLLQQRWGYLTV